MKKHFYHFLLTPLFIFFSISLFGQNVGIGTTTPTEKLQVEGNILTDTVKLNAMLLTPNAGEGKILTSDNIGNASWQENNIPANENIGYGVWGDCATNGNIGNYLPLADTAGALNDKLGYSVAISGNFAIVGASDDDETYVDQGSAIIYQFDGITWNYMQKLTDADGASGDNFGISVAISGNYAIVGAYGDYGTYFEQGSASIFQFNGSTWEVMEKLIDPEGQTFGEFGYSVSISGEYAIIGSYGDNNSYIDQGSASIYQYNGSNWILMEKLWDADGGQYDYFGVSVSIAGNYAIIGAIGDDINLDSQGSASIYQYDGSTWTLMDKIVDANGYENDYFGYSVSISGSNAIVGVIYRNLGGYSDAGMAIIFQYNGIHWQEVERIIGPEPAVSDNFGNSVSISGQYAIIGEFKNDVESNLDRGSASIYQHVGLGWQKLQFVTDPGGDEEAFFGSSVAIDGSNDRFVIGAYGYGGSSGKVVFGKIK